MSTPVDARRPRAPLVAILAYTFESCFPRRRWLAVLLPWRAWRSVRRALPMLREVFGEHGTPGTSLRRRVGPHRRCAVIRTLSPCLRTLPSTT